MQTDSLSKTAETKSHDEHKSSVSCVSHVATAFGYFSLMCESVLTLSFNYYLKHRHACVYELVKTLSCAWEDHWTDLGTGQGNHDVGGPLEQSLNEGSAKMLGYKVTIEKNLMKPWAELWYLHTWAYILNAKQHIWWFVSFPGTLVGAVPEVLTVL